jgi:predicted amidophosphoribosyltransferase
MVRPTKIQKALRELNPQCTECNCGVCVDEEGVIKTIYCPDCGTKLVQPSLCKICGNPVNAGSKYCTGCGIEMVRDKQDE